MFFAQIKTKIRNVVSVVSGFGIYHLGKQFGRKRRYKVGIKRLFNASKTIDFSTFAIYVCRLPWHTNSTFIMRYSPKSISVSILA